MYRALPSHLSTPFSIRTFQTRLDDEHVQWCIARGRPLSRNNPVCCTLTLCSSNPCHWNDSRGPHELERIFRRNYDNTLRDRNVVRAASHSASGSDKAARVPSREQELTQGRRDAGRHVAWVPRHSVPRAFADRRGWPHARRRTRWGTAAASLRLRVAARQTLGARCCILTRTTLTRAAGRREPRATSAAAAHHGTGRSSRRLGIVDGNRRGVVHARVRNPLVSFLGERSGPRHSGIDEEQQNDAHT